MSLLLGRQMLFARTLPRLLDRANNLGYGFTLGELWRPPEMVAIYAARGSGSSTSVHPDKCAVDINLFWLDKLITNATGHSELGAYWKSFSPFHRWGGDFPTADYNHYSVTPDNLRA